MNDKQPMNALREDVRVEQPYRSLSPQAIICLILGVLSSTALAHPILFVLPVVALAVGVMALREIRANPAELSGARLAVLGVALATLFGSWVISYKLASEHLLSKQAREVGQSWVDLVASGELRAAHQLMTRSDDRAAERADLAEYYAAHREARQAFERVFESEPAQSIAAAGEQARVRIRRAIEVIRDPNNTAVRYACDFRRGETDHEFEMVLLRRESRTTTGVWYVAEVSQSGPGSAPP